MKKEKNDFPLQFVQFLYLPCIKSLLEKGRYGHRSLGANLLAIVCRIDGLSKKDALIIGKKYYENCDLKEEYEFTFREVKAWFDFIYNKKSNEIFWTCKKPKELDICPNPINCPLFSKGNKRIINLRH